jgi:misacylated tRNA(Ala) deacylase
MRFHTATHLLCALVPHPVDGCSITADYARLDFHMNEPLDKERSRPASPAWSPRRTRCATAGSPTPSSTPTRLVRSMSVQPPRGTGAVRLLEIEGVDLQPCGGTHVANTAEIGAVVVTKIEKKSAMTRGSCSGSPTPARPADALYLLAEVVVAALHDCPTGRTRP